MSWIYGATGEMGFWNEQIRSEARVKKQWERTYGVSIPEEREAAEAKAREAEAKAEAHKAYIAEATARIFNEIKSTANEFNARGDLRVGADIAGFLRVGNVMLSHGAV